MSFQYIFIKDAVCEAGFHVLLSGGCHDHSWSGSLQPLPWPPQQESEHQPEALPQPMGQTDHRSV